MNVEMGTEASQFLFWEYINGILVAVYSYLSILSSYRSLFSYTLHSYVPQVCPPSLLPSSSSVSTHHLFFDSLLSSYPLILILFFLVSSSTSSSSSSIPNFSAPTLSSFAPFFNFFCFILQKFLILCMALGPILCAPAFLYFHTVLSFFHTFIISYFHTFIRSYSTMILILCYRSCSISFQFFIPSVAPIFSSSTHVLPIIRRLLNSFRFPALGLL
jgi:hypothetical protein